MEKNDKDLTALIKALANDPKRDNSLYHRAVAEARRAFAEAEAHIQGPVALKTKIRKRKDKVTIKWTFKPEE
ncbi:hypothetical protein [Rhizobium alvei]|jgi:hypothetical protein|uniref:Uncharacterized protein n=1 Tax=Rhizobium alvei TaxID=1132659 RepID=A0ABT8YTL4_9HYPH|nr:hypothetical protein [Rhizobium alvei]MDO6967084.1 hypothetical protein [Rhizobium alvei]